MTSKVLVPARRSVFATLHDVLPAVTAMAPFASVEALLPEMQEMLLENSVGIERIAAIVSFANRNFNQGLRAYYFGVAALSWFLHPALMIAIEML